MSVATVPRAPMEPRLRERRISVRRAEGRRRLVAVLVLVGVLCTLGLAWALIHSAFLDVDRVRVVRSGEHTSSAAIIRASGIDPGRPMVFLDTEAARRRVERLPWVARAVVTQEYPGDVEIRVTERTPIAYLRAGDGVDVVDRSGRVLGRVPIAPPGLVELAGLLPVAAPGERIDPAGLAGFVTELPALFAQKVARVSLAGEDITAVLVDGREVRFGALAQVAAKAAAAEAVLERIGDEAVRYVDVGVPTAPVTG